VTQPHIVLTQWQIHCHKVVAGASEGPGYSSYLSPLGFELQLQKITNFQFCL